MLIKREAKFSWLDRDEQCQCTYDACVKKKKLTSQRSADYKVATNLSWHQNYCLCAFVVSRGQRVHLNRREVEMRVQQTAFCRQSRDVFTCHFDCLYSYAFESGVFEIQFYSSTPFSSGFCTITIHARVMGVNFNYKTTKNFKQIAHHS